MADKAMALQDNARKRLLEIDKAELDAEQRFQIAELQANAQLQAAMIQAKNKDSYILLEQAKKDPNCYTIVDVNGKIVFVTGGASGIGRAMCRGFHKQGAGAVAVADINEKDARGVADEVGGLAIRCDVGKETDVINAVRRTEGELGAVDICCSNAGI